MRLVLVTRRNGRAGGCRAVNVGPVGGPRARLLRRLLRVIVGSLRLGPLGVMLLGVVLARGVAALGKGIFVGDAVAAQVSVARVAVASAFS